MKRLKTEDLMSVGEKVSDMLASSEASMSIKNICSEKFWVLNVSIQDDMANLREIEVFVEPSAYEQDPDSFDWTFYTNEHYDDTGLVDETQELFELIYAHLKGM